MVRPIDTANLLDQLEALAGSKKSIMPSSALDRLKHLDFSSLNKSLDYGDVHVPRLVGDDMEDDDERKDHEEGEDDDIGKASDSDFVLQALKDETEGMSSYDQALQTVQDPKLKEILEAIKEDETKHNAALEAWLKDNDPDALEGHEGEETLDQEAAEDDEAAEGEEGDLDKDEPGSKEDLIAEIEAVLAEHDGSGSDEDLGKEDDGEDDSEPDEDDDEAVDKCRLDKFMPIVKLDDEKHKAYCVVAEPDVFDLQGDRSSEQEIEKASDRFMKRLQKTCGPGVGVHHERPIHAYVIENVVTQHPGVKLGPDILRKGTWYQGHDLEEEPEIWADIKSGEITGLSRQGEGVRSPVGKGLMEMRRISKSGRVVKTKLYDLSDEDIDRIDWVHKGANGKRIAIVKFTGGKTMKSKPAGADRAGAGEAQAISKAEIADMIAEGIRVGVEKAVAPIINENKRLHKTQKGLVDTLRAKDLELVAKSELGELGKPSEMSKILKSLEDSNLPADDQKQIITTLKQANAMKKEAGKLLYSPLGSSRPAPGTPADVFEAAVQERMDHIQKSDNPPKNAMVAHALATKWVVENRDDLFKAITGGE
jgi:hypothetical protein